MVSSVEVRSWDGISKIHRIRKPRRNNVLVHEAITSDSTRNLRVSYLNLPPGTVFIGQEPTTMASAEEIRQRPMDQLGTLMTKLENGEPIDPQWFEFVNHISERAPLEEPLQKPT